MKKLHELPKDILIQLVVNVNNPKFMSDEELQEKCDSFSLEIKRRNNEKKSKIVKESLLQLQIFPHLKQFILENIECIKSIQIVSTDYLPQIVRNDLNANFLMSLSKLYIHGRFIQSLLQDITAYIETGKSDKFWLPSTQSEHSICTICNKKEFAFYNKTKCTCIVLFEDDSLCSSGHPRNIWICSECEKVHCCHHNCKTKIFNT